MAEIRQVFLERFELDIEVAVTDYAREHDLDILGGMQGLLDMVYNGGNATILESYLRLAGICTTS